MFFRSLAILALAATPTFATVFITSPTASTTFSGGQPAQINWQDDGTVPSLQAFGNATVSIYVGNAQQQTSLQTIVASVNVSTTSSIQFNVDPTIGPNSNEYFIRVQSLAFMDPKNPQFPAMSFSAKFSLNNMSGQFNSSVEAQIAGQSTAPIGGPTTPASASPTNELSNDQPSLTTSRVVSAATTTSNSTSSSTNSALEFKAGWAGVILSALVGVAAF